MRVRLHLIRRIGSERLGMGGLLGDEYFVLFRRTVGVTLNRTYPHMANEQTQPYIYNWYCFFIPVIGNSKDENIPLYNEFCTSAPL